MPGRQNRFRRSDRRGEFSAPPHAQARAGRRDRSPTVRTPRPGRPRSLRDRRRSWRSAFAIAGMADRFSAAMPGNTARMSGVRCRCASTVMIRSTVPGEEPADGSLADRFAFVEGCVLAHVAEIGRQQDRAGWRRPDAALRRRTAERSACHSAGRARHRGSWSRRRSPTVTRISPSGKRWIAISWQGRRSSQASRLASPVAGWQALNGEPGHDGVLPGRMSLSIA